MKTSDTHRNRPRGFQRPLGYVTNQEFADDDPIFLRACEGAGVQPTARQASKWRRHCGQAYHWHIRPVK